MTSDWSCHSGQHVSVDCRNERSAPEHWRVLVIDDELTILRMLQCALRIAGIDCITAGSGEEGIKLAVDPSVDLVLIDLNLGDSDGLTIIERLRAQGCLVPFAIITGHASVPLAVRGVQSGALDVIQKPFLVDDIVAKTKTWLRAGRTIQNGATETRHFIDTTGLSAAARWAVFVMRGTQAKNDPKTLDQWALYAHTNYTSLREASKLVGVEPQDARDFLRMLRAAMRSQCEAQAIEAFLNVHDFRRLSALFQRSGLGRPRSGVTVSVAGFIARQNFILPNNEGLKALVELLRERSLMP